MELHERNTYLTDIPVSDARDRLYQALQQYNRFTPLDGETVSLADALNRITAEPIWAKQSAPHYHASAMDGYAVFAASTRDATETRPIQLELNKQAYPVNTGAPIPDGTNAVIMIEHVQHHDNTIEITSAVAPWQHVRMMGEDMVATELILPSNHKIRPVDLGAIAGCGHHQVVVRRQPRITLIPTGSELVDTQTPPQPGQVIEYNSLVLSGQLLNMGALPKTTTIIPDDPEQLKTQIQQSLSEQPDMVFVLSGSSAGSRDFTATAIQDVGTLLVHGIAVRPGHPVVMGISNDGIPIIGIPGYPVSAALTNEIFIEPIIAMWLGITPQQNDTIQATLTQKLNSPIGDDDYVRVTVAKVGDHYLTTPIAKGAGVITSLVRADGIAHIPRFSEGVDMGEEIQVALYRTKQELDTTLLAMGSHDPMLDLLNQFLAEKHHIRLTSANVGSMGGIVALKRGHAHLAGTHLLDIESGTYNVPYIQKHLKKQPVHLITFAHREQGLIIPAGNPKNIQSLDNLPNIQYVNRQRGAGTRQLLDYELQQRGISQESVSGYEREEYTHLAVAAAVATGIADCGLGVRSAAIALELDFIAVGWERYDIMIPSEYMTHSSIMALLDVLNSVEFKTALSNQPGYSTEETGVEQYVHTP